MIPYLTRLKNLESDDILGLFLFFNIGVLTVLLFNDVIIDAFFFSLLVNNLLLEVQYLLKLIKKQKKV
jgi:hypothetical protein